MSSSSSLSDFDESSQYDELFMEQTLLFSDSLKELKNLRSQLYSAADSFELSYTNDDQKQIVVDTLKDYAIRALVNTVDHLSCVTFKVDEMVDERVNEVSGTELRVSCIEQRLRTCQEYIDHEGLSQQSLTITTPKHHKRYLLSVDETNQIPDGALSANYSCSLDDDNYHKFNNDVPSTIGKTPSSTTSKGRSRSPSPQRSTQHRIGVISFTEKQMMSGGERTIPEKRTVSPSRARFPLLRSVSLSSRSTSPISSRPITPSSSNVRHRNSVDGRRSASIQLDTEWDNRKDVERQPRKSKSFLKALLSRQKSKKDEALYTFLDSY